MMNQLPIVLISDNNFVMQTMALVISIIKNKNTNTELEIFIVMAECSEQSQNQIMALDAYEHVNVHIMNVTLERYRDFRQMAHIPIACLLKFDICDLIDNWDKILYLDGDMIVRKDLWELYQTDLNDCYGAAVYESYNILDGQDNFNAGLLLLDAKQIREENIREQLTETRRTLGDRASMDQQTFNIVLKGRIKKLPVKYNCMVEKILVERKSYPMQAWNRYYGCAYKSRREIFEHAEVIHFAGKEKPWKYYDIPYAEEWYAYYSLLPGVKDKLIRYGKWHRAVSVLKTEGFSRFLAVYGYKLYLIFGPERDRRGKIKPNSWNQ